MLNVDLLLNAPARVYRQQFTRRDTILYALGVGVAQQNQLDPNDLRFVYEPRLEALPTLAIVLAAPPFWLDEPAYGIDWRKVVNAGQQLVIERTLPVEGEVSTELSIDSLWDKGPAKGALMCSSRRLRDANGSLLASVHQTHLLRGNGGFGGVDQPAPAETHWPERAPDASMDLPTRADQGLLYRLSGDLNPLHIDPDVARSAGFDKPILHGSCTFGIAARAVLKLAANDCPARLRRFGARFSKPVYPGETIRTELWWETKQILFRARSLERDVVVLDRGTAEVLGENAVHG